MEEKENPQNQIAYSESYFMFKKLISEIFILPLILYILAIAFITHVSIFNQPLKSQINIYTSKKRKILFLILIFLYLCHIISLIKVTKLENSPNTVSSSLTLIILLFYTLLVMAVLLTIFFIDEKNKKQIKLDKRNPLEWFIILNIIYFLLDLVNEIVYGYFSFLTPFTFCYCIYFEIFVYRYPDDNYKIFLSKGFKYIELNEFDKELINTKLQNLKINEQKYKLNNKDRIYIPMTYVNSKANMLGDEDPEDNNNNKDKENNDNNKDNNNNKLNQLINDLYNRNFNDDYLKNSYKYILKIEVNFQSNFSIDYGTYYNYNKTKKNILNNQNNNNSIKNRFSLLSINNLIDDDDEQDDHLDIANFYTSIIFSFTVSATSSLYITNKHLRKSLEEFFKLDILLENEFTEERYDLSLIKKLPRLNIKKCFDELSNNIKKGVKINNSSNNSDILLECIQNTKNICEKYLKDITSNPHFIIPEVLFFLEIRDQNVFQLYININDKIRKEDNNIISRFSRKSDNSLSNNFYLSTNCNYFTSHDDYNMNIILRIIKGDYFVNAIKNKNKKAKENNDYYLLIRITYGECNKLIKKKFDETIFVLQEFNKLLDNNNDKKIINKKKENDEIIIKLYDKFLGIYSKLNEIGDGPTQSFRLNKNSKILEYFKKYPDEIKENDDNLFGEFIIIIENILNLIINYYIDEIPNTNQIIHEYFIDYIDDYWNVEKLKKYIKHDNNLLSLFQTAIKQKAINDINVLDKNYLYININYKVTVFYELCFKITTSSSFIQFDKRYEFEEVKNYIDLMNVELSLGLVWPEKCFLQREEFEDDINNNIHIIRLNYMSKYLLKIFNANKIFNTSNWRKIFYDDKSYHDVIEIKFKELKYNHNKKNSNKNEHITNKKTSNESNSFYLNNNTIKLSENSFNFYSSFKNDVASENIKNENNLILDNENSDKLLSKNNFFINNSEEESANSIETITSHFSKNSKTKNLFDI